MRHPSRTNQELLAENALLKQRIRELETAKSDYKRSQEELWKSESKYRILFDQATNGIMIMPLEGTNFIVNDSFAKLHGYDSPKEMEQLTLSDLDTPETAKLAPERLRRLIAGESLNFEVEHYHKDGHSTFFEVSCNVVRIDGKPHFLGFHNDITARRQAEQAQRKSEELYQTFMNATPDMAFMKDELFRNVVVNKSMVLFFDKPEVEIIGKSDFELMPQLAAEKCRQTDMEALASNSIVISEEIVGKQIFETIKFPVELGRNRTGVGGFIRDITSRKRVEEALERVHAELEQRITDRTKALQESESRFRDLVELIPVVVYEIDVNYRLTFANHRAVDLFGYSKEELAGLDSISMIIPEDRKRLMENFMRRLKGEKIGTNDYVGIKKDGSKFPILLQSVPIQRDGKLIGARGIVIDITERKQIEDKLQNTLNFLLILFNTIPSPIFCKDINGMYVDCNKEFEKYTGFERKDIIGKSVYDMYSQDIADKYHEMDIALFGNPGKQIYEHPIIYADGKRHDVVVNKATYLNADGTVAGLVGVMVDITERKRTEEELRANKEQYSFLIRNTSDYVARYSLNGDLLFASDGIQFMLGYKPQEVIGTSGLDRVHPDDRSIVQEALKKALEITQGTDSKIEYRTMCQGGSYLWVELSGKTVWNNQTGKMEVIATVRNINDRKQAEDELAKYREGLEQLVLERTHDLENKTKSLEEVNIALKVLLQHREEDKKELEDRFVMNVNNLIIPFAEKMKNTNLDERQLAYLGIIETHLKDITSSMIKKFNQFNLTPAEVEVASLIKEGKATKEIAKIIGIATSSIDTHRNNIRKKLGISQKAVNLRSHLQSFN
jgi:PAS domain S-box-containing protein